MDLQWRWYLMGITALLFLGRGQVCVYLTLPRPYFRVGFTGSVCFGTVSRWSCLSCIETIGQNVHSYIDIYVTRSTITGQNGYKIENFETLLQRLRKKILLHQLGTKPSFLASKEYIATCIFRPSSCRNQILPTSKKYMQHLSKYIFRSVWYFDYWLNI